MRDKLDNYLHLRLLVGYLGESQQHGWWATSFFQTSSRVFLEPIFPRTMLLAQYHGIREAARLLHDERIGVGNVFHLFRLPEDIERELHKKVEEKAGLESIIDSLKSRDSAILALESLAEGTIDATEGPINIGKFIDIHKAKAIKDLARHYLAAFGQGIQTYPYYMGDRE